MPKWKGLYIVVKHFRTVYWIMTSFKIMKLYHFDLLKPYNTDVPQWIVRARKHFGMTQAIGICRWEKWSLKGKSQSIKHQPMMNPCSNYRPIQRPVHDDQ